MSGSRLEVNFDSGDVALCIDGKSESLTALAKANPSPVRHHAVDLNGVCVSVVASQIDGKAKVIIFPPSDLDFESCEFRAVEIAKALASKCPKPIFPMNQYAVFKWGNLTEVPSVFRLPKGVFHATCFS